MRYFILPIAVALSSVAMADEILDITIQATVSAIDVLGVSGSPPPLITSTATAGFHPDPVTDSSTSYAYSTNSPTPRRITGYLDQTLPIGLTLQASLTAPGGASSNGYVTLSPNNSIFITGISAGFKSNLTIQFKQLATAEAEPLVPGSRTFTLTLEQ